MPKIKITNEVKIAINKAIDELGSQVALENKTGISQKNISKYISGNIYTITEGIWSRLYPAISKYLPEEYKINQKNIHSNINQSIYGNVNSSAFEYKNLYTKELIDKFGKLNIDHQKSIISYTEELLEEESITPEDYILTEDELDELKNLGIDCEYNEEFSISFKGLEWLYNVIVYSRNTGQELDNYLFKRLLKIDLPEKVCRELRIKNFKIDVYDDRIYDQLAIYLNGSPPRCYTSHFTDARISKRVTLNYGTAGLPFKISEHNILDIVFTDDELEKLKKGETLPITL